MKENIICFIFLIIFSCIAVWRQDNRHILNSDLYFRICSILKKCTSQYRRLFRYINWEKTSLLVLATSLLLVIVLTLIGRWGMSAEPDTNIDHFVFESLRVAFSVFEGDSADFRNHASFAPILAIILSILVPMSATATAITLLWNHLPHHIPYFSYIWYVFSELDPNSIRMAKSIHKESEQSLNSCVFIFLRTQRGKQDLEVLEELKDLNYFFYPWDESRFLSRKNRRKRILRFFFLTENTDENFNQMQDFLTAASKDSLLEPIEYALPDGQFQHELYLLSETESAPMLIDHLRDSLKKAPHKQIFQNTDLRLLDRFRAVSYDLLYRHQPLYKFHEDGQLNILLLGFGRIGREFFRAAWSMGVLPGCTTTFTVCDRDICTKLNQFKTICPEFHKAQNILPRKLNADSESLDELIHANTYHYIVVALGDDERNIRVASRLKRYYRCGHWNDPDTIQPQICVNIEDTVKHAYTKLLWNAKFDWDKSIHTFGGLDQAFTREVLMPENLWAAASYVHKLVNDSKERALRLWSEYMRRSSIACAAHASCYIAHLLDDKDFDANRQNLPARYQDAWKKCAYQEKLIDTEHGRWMAYVGGEGMQQADLDLVKAYFPHLKNHVDTHARLTPCLVEPDQLGNVQECVDQLRKKYPPDNNPSTHPINFRKRDELIVEYAALIHETINPT